MEKPIGRKGRPRGNEEDRRHLEFHGGTYRVVLTVPERVRGIVGIARFRQDLGTSDLKFAAIAKREPLARFKARIDAALAEIGETQEARELAACRAILIDYRLYPDRYTAAEIESVERRLRGLGDEGEEVLERIEPPVLPAPTETPLAALHDEYLAAQAERLAPSTLAGDREAIRWLLRWLAGERLSPSIETMTPVRCRHYADVLQDLAGIAPATASRMLSRLSAFWKWAGKRAIVAENPWTRLAADVRQNTQSDS